MSSAQKLRIFAASTSLLVGTAIFVAKFKAYQITGSSAVLSDALESVVNIIAAVFSLFAIYHAHTPPDTNHPYGHGKIEFIAAVFEGGLICFAAALIAFETLQSWQRGIIPQELHTGIWITTACGLANGILGGFLIRIGRRTHSLALEADGKHILTDFLSSLGVILALVAVHFTGWNWIDHIAALAMAALLLFTGLPLVKKAINGLLDATDFALIHQLLRAFQKYREPGCINIHHVRAMRNGRRIHIDGHMVIPEFWTIDAAHSFVDSMNDKIVGELFPEGGEISLHLDPCRKRYCTQCPITNCPIRQKPLKIVNELTLADLLNPEENTDAL